MWLDPSMNIMVLIWKSVKTAIFVVLEDPFRDPSYVIKNYNLTSSIIVTTYSDCNNDRNSY